MNKSIRDFRIRHLRAALSWLTLVLALAYPFLVYVGLSLSEPRWVAAGLSVLVVARIVAGVDGAYKAFSFFLLPSVIVCIVLLLEIVLNRGTYFLYVPMLVNLGLLGLFASTLVWKPTLAERFARMQVPDLTEEHIRYCRSVTILWCVFFVVNGSISVYTAMYSKFTTWTFYNGFLMYVLIALVFATELLYRSWRFREYTGGHLDWLLQRLFPPLPHPADFDRND